jgi:prephenate dehydrogenase
LKGLSLQRGTVAAEGPGFASATRVAGGPEAMWRDVFESNADAIAAAGRELAQELSEALAALEQTPPDVEPALALLARARRAT